MSASGSYKAPKKRVRKVAPVSDSDRLVYGETLRKTWEGRGQAAVGGDGQALRELAAIGRVLLSRIEQGELEPSSDGARQAAGWLAFILSEISRGVSPNVAFGWSKINNSATNFEGLQRHALLLDDARALAAQLHDVSPAQAKKILENHWGVGSGTLIDDGRFKPGQTKLSAADARSLAAAGICAYHLANLPDEHWGQSSLKAFKPLAAATLERKMSEKVK